MTKNIGWVIGAVFVCSFHVFGVNTATIESLRLSSQQSRTELTAAETAVISQFWTAALDQMLLAPASQDMVEVRRQIEVQKGNESLSFYTTAYIAEALKDIQAAFQNVQRVENPRQRLNAERNLMILTANLASPKLAPLGLERLDAADEVIRYWAVKAVTQPAVAEQLVADVTRDEAAVEAILNAINKRILVEPLANIQKMMIDFAAPFNLPAARQALLSLADQRIKAYRQWTVRDELLDVNLLRALGNIMVLQQDAEIKKTFGRAFGELYALAFQRYLKGAGKLSADQTEQLKTVIGEVDQAVVTKVMGIQTGVAKALQSNTGLERQYEMLFGNRQIAGEFGARFNFDYGKDAAGKALTTPAELGPMPEAAQPAE